MTPEPWKEFDEFIDEQLGPEPSVQDLFAFAQRWEEIADSYGGADGRYREADYIWSRAFIAAERAGGAEQLERMARDYGWSTPVQREAEREFGIGD